MIWYRVDNRLIHGQVIEAWLPYTGATFLIVANDAMAEDQVQQQIMLLAVPSRIKTVFATVEKLIAMTERQIAKKESTLVLFANCQDARRAHRIGLPMQVFNIGNLHYAPGKQQICPHVAISTEDAECLVYFREKFVNLDFRSVPNDTPQVKDWGQPKDWG